MTTADASAQDGSAEHLASLIAQARDCISAPSQKQHDLITRLAGLHDRLAAKRFQLAIVGQFKRGKSTLLNALLGARVLATGLLPVTALPVLLERGVGYAISVTLLDGAVQETAYSDGEAFAARLADLATEAGNPNNEKDIAQIRAKMPLAVPLRDVVFIDTPGIGSTHSHNTTAARAALPECDAALFVLSADPPLTMEELAYFSQVCEAAAHMIVVINKIDLVDATSLDELTAFTLGALPRDDRGRRDPAIFGVSAKSALSARLSGDAVALASSGVPALEKHVLATLVARKRELLAASVAHKSQTLIDLLAADVDLAVYALQMPLADLDRRIVELDALTAFFAREARSLQDRLNGEWKRVVVDLEARCQQVGAEASKALGVEALDGSEIDEAIKHYFDNAFRAIVDFTREAVATAASDALEGCRSAAERLTASASAILDVALTNEPPEVGLELRREPYWISSGLTDSLGSITADYACRLLPAWLRNRRQNRQARRAINTAINRNVSDLNWAMRQNVDDAFRSLLSQSHGSIYGAIDATVTALKAARVRRGAKGLIDAPLVAELNRTATQLRRLSASIASNVV